MRFLWLVLVAGLLQLTAADNSLTDEEKESGWILLFDGKSLDAWQDPRSMQPAGDAWSIEDGAIKTHRTARVREDLISRQNFGDFELVFDWRISPRGNSGVKYRIQDVVVLQRGKTKPGARFEEMVDHEYGHRLGDRSKVGPSDRIEAYSIGFEFQLIDDSAAPGSPLPPDQRSGALYSMIAASQAAAKPAGEWNAARLVVRGNRIEHWLNGVKVVDAELTDRSVAVALEKRWSKASPVYRLLTTQPKRATPIALQNHNSEAWFKNLKIRPL
jgi:hypothetical protein